MSSSLSPTLISWLSTTWTATIRPVTSGAIDPGLVVTRLEGLRRLAGATQPPGRGRRPRRAAGRPPTSCRPRCRCPRPPRAGAGRVRSSEGWSDRLIGARRRRSTPARGRSAAREGGDERRRPGRRRGRPRARRAGATCPAATVGGRMAGTSRPAVEQRRGGGDGVALVADDDGDDGRGVPGCRAVDEAPQVGPQGVALGRAHDADARRARRRCRPACAAVVKMYGRARLTSSSMAAAAAGDEPAERAERLRQRADPHDVDAVEQPVGVERRVGAEHGVGLVEHEQRPVAAAAVDELVHRRDVAVHREHGVGDDDGAPAGRARSASVQRPVEVVDVAVAVDRPRRRGPGGCRR